MSIVILAVAVVLVYKAKVSRTLRDDYMSIKQTQAINGLFIILVFLRHFNQYVVFENKIDEGFLFINRELGQLIVTTFMFYSGYGVMVSIMKKGRTYLKAMPMQRILKTLLLFDGAILLYVIMNFLTKTPQTLPQIALSFIGWESVGNSNWYIFAISMMYAITYFSFMATEPISRKSKFGTVLALGSVLVLILAYMLIVKRYKDSQFYNTVMCYGFGMCFAYFKPYADKMVKSFPAYLTALVLSVVTFAFSYIFRDSNLLINQAYYFMFVAVIVLVTMRVKLGNGVLEWCGKNLLGLYILQRLPMIFLGKINVISQHLYLYFLLSAIITVVLTIGYDKFVMVNISKIFSKKKS